VWDGVYTKEQAQRGQPLYKQYCASCHGEMLEGIEMAPPLAGAEFLDQWSGQTLGDLFERIRATMPRDKPGRLSRDVNADITAYMLGYNQFPAGNTELSRDTQVLQQIRIDAVKPH
jgi:quinoprotein glucose dehydrogenase